MPRVAPARDQLENGQSFRGQRRLREDALSAGYGQTLIVDDINLTIPTGKMTVLAGANGSGKSTLLST
ncbi:ATP-binding cassette domain-containing protein, partial [Klebsiella pneumoniae]|nr:ATP-binding cassette domain-containing protein [Klebsiella pneumoniae]